MQKFNYDQVGEELYYQKMKNGLEVFVIPKRNFAQTYAVMATKYGSIDNEFRVDNQSKIKVVDGIAHFLEHKMFEQPSGVDVFLEFSEHGASTNAFTSYTTTAYLFSCTDALNDNLRILLDFVQEPHFTDENVNKEKGIIAQELEMYHDDPSWRLYLGLLNGLYEHCPVRIDIGGTVESIQEITKEDLYACYNIFYHPKNMVLCIVGDADPQDVFAQVQANQDKKNFPKLGSVKRFYPDEPDTVAQALTELKLNVGVPKVIFGFKEPNASLTKRGVDALKQELLTRIGLEALLGSTSELYQSLYNGGLIDKSFSHNYSLETIYGFSSFGGNTKQPDRLIAEIKERIPALVEKGISSKDFARIHKKELGQSLAIFDSPEVIAKEFINYRFNNIDLFTVLPVLADITLEEVTERLREHCDMNRMAISVLRPLENG